MCRIYGTGRRVDWFLLPGVIVEASGSGRTETEDTSMVGEGIAPSADHTGVRRSCASFSFVTGQAGNDLSSDIVS